MACGIWHVFDLWNRPEQGFVATAQVLVHMVSPTNKKPAHTAHHAAWYFESQQELKGARNSTHNHTQLKPHIPYILRY